MDREKSITSRDEPQVAQNSQMAQNYFFRVAGTNLTLKQNVVFAGNLLANFNATANGQQANDRNGNFGGGGGVGGQLQSATDEPIAVGEFAHRRNGGGFRHQQY